MAGWSQTTLKLLSGDLSGWHWQNPAYWNDCAAAINERAGYERFPLRQTNDGGAQLRTDSQSHGWWDMQRWIQQTFAWWACLKDPDNGYAPFRSPTYYDNRWAWSQPVPIWLNYDDAWRKFCESADVALGDFRRRTVSSWPGNWTGYSAGDFAKGKINGDMEPPERDGYDVIGPWVVVDIVRLLKQLLWYPVDCTWTGTDHPLLEHSRRMGNSDAGATWDDAKDKAQNGLFGYDSNPTYDFLGTGAETPQAYTHAIFDPEAFDDYYAEAQRHRMYAGIGSPWPDLHCDVDFYAVAEYLGADADFNDYGDPHNSPNGTRFTRDPMDGPKWVLWDSRADQTGEAVDSSYPLGDYASGRMPGGSVGAWPPDPATTPGPRRLGWVLDGSYAILRLDVPGGFEYV